MQRTAKYRVFRKAIEAIAHKLSAAETSPLGRNSVMGLRKHQKAYDLLDDKWRAYIDAKIEKDLNAYHKAAVYGMDGQWYSAYDMDMAMLY